MLWRNQTFCTKSQISAKAVKRVQHDSKIHDVTLNLFQGLSNFKTTQKNKQIAFTLAEVLITLVIIGIIAAITVPTLMNNSKWSEYRSAAWKAKNILDNAMQMYYAKEGEIPQCGYWYPNPYGDTECREYDAAGKCLGYQLIGGGNIPTDYNGPRDDCKKVYDFLLKNLNIAKYCSEKAYANGCIPKYDGLDDIAMNNGVSDVDANKALVGLSSWSTTGIANSPAIVTTDGIIFIPYYDSNFDYPLFLIDVNGQKGPNKLGHDVITLTGTMKKRYDIPKYIPRQHKKDRLGKYTDELMYGKD